MVYYIYMRQKRCALIVILSLLCMLFIGTPLLANSTGEILYASSFSEEREPPTKEKQAEKKTPEKKEAQPLGTKVTQNTLVMYTPEAEDNTQQEGVLEVQREKNESQSAFQPKAISFGLTGDLYIEDQNFALYAAPFFQYYKDNFKLRFEIPANLYFRQSNEWKFGFDDRGWQFFTDPSFWPIYQGILHKVDTIAYSLRIQNAEIFSFDFSRRERKGLSSGGLISPALEDPRYRMALQGALYVNTTFFSAEAYTPNIEDLNVVGGRLGLHSSSRHPVETGVSVAYGSDLQAANSLGLLAMGVDQYIPLFTTAKTKTGLLLETGIIAPIEEGNLDWKAIAQISSGFFKSLDSFYLSGGVTIRSERFSSNHYVSYSRSIYRGFFNQYYRDNQSAIHSMYANETSSGVYEDGPYMIQYETDNRITFGKEQQLRIVYALNFSQSPIDKNWDYNFDRFTALWTLNDPLAYKRWHGSAGISMENLGGLIKGDQSFLEFTKSKNTYLYGSIRYGITDFLFIQGALSVGKDPVSASLGVTLRF